MAVDRVKFQDIVESQFPRYVLEDFPLLPEFLKQYYKSQEYQGGTYDLIQNIDEYIKVDELFSLKSSTTLNGDLDFFATTIPTSSLTNFTEGFPDTNGLIKIDDEIIHYESISNNSFVNCTRGFSGITTYITSNKPDQLTFEQTEIDEHDDGSTIHNLNIIFLQEFFKKLKNQIAPGFNERQFFSGLDQRNFLYNADSFYKSKGTDQSFKILFRSLYGEEVKIIKPSDFLFKLSDADYKITQDFVVETISGDPMDLMNLTLFQDSTGARGSVTNVNRIQYDEGQYYQISIDYGFARDISVRGSIFGEFKPNPKTKILNTIGAGATIIDVDSTIGFPESGELVIFNSIGNPIILDYTGKNVNQFFNVSGTTENFEKKTDIRLDDNSYGYVGMDTSNSVSVRITSTLKEFKLDDNSYNYSENDTINIQSLGIERGDERSDNWYSNVKTEWDIESISLVDALEQSYSITLFDNHFLRPGYAIILISNSGQQLPGVVIRSSSATSFTTKLTANIGSISYVKVENQLLKGNSGKYPKLNEYVANVQNIYQKYNGDVAVASNSLPNYSNIFTDPYDKKITFNGTSESDNQTLVVTTNRDHGFLTGDAIIYKPGIITTTTVSPNGIEITTEEESKFSDVDSNVYYIKRVNSTSFKLARSRSDIFSNKFVILSGEVTDNEFIYFDFFNKKLKPQSIVREILEPDNKSGQYETDPGYTGILINGVEILNYKSGESIKYGDLRTLEITNSGEGYDVINPPVLSILDEYGSGSEGNVSVEGTLQGINIVDRGFDYLETPTVLITGGNPEVEAKAEVSMTSIVHSLTFNSEVTGQSIDIDNDSIGFSTFHKLNVGDKVLYDVKDGETIVGLTTDAYYFASLVDTSTIKLHRTKENAVSGINTVDISDYGVGVQAITAVGGKQVVSSVYITNPGSGYKNRRRNIPVTGINTAQNRFVIPNHGYSSGEIIKYSTTSSGIVGLSTNDQYYVDKLDDDTFSLSLVGSGNTDKTFFYDRDILVDIKTSGNGSFNYLPIEFTLSGRIGVTTVTGQDFQCKIEPLFRGSIHSVDLTSNGVSYGSSEIVNFNRQPNISFKSGSGALLTPIISNSQIVDIIVNDGGSDYNSPPNLIIRGDGKFAKLTPVIDNGTITSVIIQSGGRDFVSGSTSIEVQPAGKFGEAEAVIRNWNINLFERDFDNIDVDDGFVSESIDDSSLEYSHLYAPRPLRSNTYVISGNDETQYGISDLTLSGGVEKTGSYHSPILGWAYDGNPIYGPYGFTDPQGGNISQMVSGYELIDNPTNRPPTSLFPLGYFIEDYIFTDRGDLDEHNGRFCVTPDYPTGKYCYFSTLNTFTVDSSGPFKNYKRPVYPYLIGDSFYSKPNITNFKVTSNQIDYNFVNGEWFRNTLAYHTNDDRSGYEYVFNSNKVRKQSLDITKVSKGVIDSVGIITGGVDYKISDRIIFGNKEDGGSDAIGRVARIDGVDVNYINFDETTVEDIEFTTILSINEFIGFATQPVSFTNDDIVTISGLSTTFNGYSGELDTRLGIKTDSFLLTLGIGTTAKTGLTTYFYISGDLNYPSIRENDILGIGTENVKVLNIDTDASRIRVRREHDGISCGLAHTNGAILFEDPRKFRINVGTIKTTVSLEANKEYYFYPEEVVGVGTVGTGTTITFSNPGVGVTQKFIPTKQIYLPEHGLSVNDILFYDKQGGTSIGAWNGISTTFKTLEEYGLFYVGPVNRDFIGLSTNKIGLGTEGEFVGVGTTSGLLMFTSVPTDDYHSFITDKDNVLTGRMTKTTVNVATSSTHGLSFRDEVYVTVKPTDTVTVNVQYDNDSRRIIFDPETIQAADSIKNTVTVMGYDFVEGDRVLYKEGLIPISGLTDGDLYYVYPYDTNSFQLVKDKYQLNEDRPQVEDITSNGNGTLSKVNPPLYVKRNNKLKFDLSSSTLSFVVSGVRNSAFELRFYTDSNYTNIFDTSKTRTSFEVTREGITGIDSDANVTLTISDEVPTNLWYKFVPINNDIITDVKSEIVIDTDVNSNNSINIENTKYDGLHAIAGVGDTTFTYNTFGSPDVGLYNLTNSKATYETTSLTAFGPISRIDLVDKGNYESVPGISTVITQLGKNAILKPNSQSIGKIRKTKFNSNRIGFDYPTDETLRPIVNPPEILELESLTSFDSIGISSGGRNYLVAPDLVILDGFTRNRVEDIDIFYNLGDTEVTINKNTTGLYNVTPEIVPINNSNGVGIGSLAYTPSNKTVRLYLDTIFNDESSFHYSIGSKIFVENLNIGVGSTGIGYNSEDYSYQYFTVTGVSTNLGGSGSYVDYSLKEYLDDTDVPGKVDFEISAGRVILVDDFPIFNPVLKKNMFFDNEIILYQGNQTGRVETWNPLSEILKVDTPKEYSVGEIVRGLTSDTQAVIRSKIDFNAEIVTGAGATITHGWQKSTGFLNENLQRIPNNEYYQNFSYSIQSRVPFDEWEDPVSALNHIAGYKDFSDLQVESSEDIPLGVVQPIGSQVELTTNIVGSAALYCFYDFDFVTENHNFINGQLTSDEIFFENRIISDYFQSVGNRVLSIDDFSSDFFSNERVTKYSDVESFNFNEIYNKVFTFVRDRTFTDERQFSIVSLLQSDQTGYIQEYATMESYPELGYFDHAPTGDGWNLQFYPYKFESNIYDVSTISISIKDNIVGLGSESLGTVALMDTKNETTPDNTLETIVSVPSSYRSVKALVLQEDEEGGYAGNELNIIHDGTDVHLLEYGQIQTKSGQYSSTGFGTFGARLSGGNILLDYTPNVGSAVTTNTSIVALSDTGTGISSITLSESRLNSNYKSISASGSPSATTILQFEEPYSTGYYIVSVKDTTNNQYEMFECAVIASESNEGFVEFANIYTGGSIGQVGVTSTANYTNLTYTPNPNAAVEVRTFGIEQKIYDNNNDSSQLNLNNVEIQSGTGLYRGTTLDLRTAFDLKHDNLPIFRRQFDGAETDTFDFDNNILFIKEHFFVTGENVTYSYGGSGTSESIGITSVNVSGIGVTDKLPQDLFIVKVGDGSVRFAESAEKALKSNPEVFTFTSVGIGTSHHITAKKQNTKALIAIDNMIQAPLAKTNVNSQLTQNIVFDSSFTTSGITSIAAADLIRIGNEIMRVVSVGVGGANNILVERQQLGTVLQPHSNGSTITKMTGTYNIVGTTINFVSPPYGAIPLSTTTSAPSERDYTGLTTHSTFQGRTFMRTAPIGSDKETYFSNHVFDDISNEFTGIRSEFRLTEDSNNVTGFSTDNAIVLINNIFQEPQGTQEIKGTYDLVESSGITSITFEEKSEAFGYDPNRTQLPIGGFIVSIGSTEGGGYQPLIGAGGTVTVSTAGTITSVSIGNSGSGYRSGIGTIFVGVQTSSLGTANITTIGEAIISNGSVTGVTITNSGVGFTGTNLPKVIIDEPHSYTNIPLIYSGSSVQGIGQSATIDIQIGAGGSIIDYRLNQEGFAYGNGEILTVPVGGPTGIPTSGTFSEFQITVDEIYNDDFNGFSIGQLQVLDKFDDQFDGIRRTFKLSVNDLPLSIQSSPGSPIDVDQTLLIFINDILQQPEVAYEFSGGSILEFVEAPQPGDTSKVLFYKGSGDVDVVFTDILETVKIGDTLDINNNPEVGQGIALDENPRTVVGVNTIDSVSTNTYSGPGVTDDTTLSRPVTWCKQQIDKIINGQEVGKDRIEYEPLIYPTSYLIQPLSVGSTYGYVDSVRPLFNNYGESSDRGFQNKIKIISQDTLVGAKAQVGQIVSLGSITDIKVTNPGVGYTQVPDVSIASPVNGDRATATATLSGGSIDSITITDDGLGYTSDNPPVVLVGEPSVVTEEILVSEYSGDYGILVGFGLSTTSSGNELILDFYIPTDSYMRDSDYVGSGITVSGISTGDYFTVFNSSVNTVTINSLRTDYTDLGITTSFIDCVYQVSDTYILEKNVIGVGNTTVRRVFTNVGGISTISFSSSFISFDSNNYTFDNRSFTVYSGGISASSQFGKFSWGKIQFEERSTPQEFNFYGDGGILGISSSGLLSRSEPLKYNNYTS